MVSIIMPAYNAEKTIKASIDSVRAQTYEDWELIIIDDASKDKTAESIPSDPRIKIFKNDKNMGVSNSRNRGISLASGDFLAFLDSDDQWHEYKLKKQLDFMKEHNCDISYTGTAYVNSQGETLPYVLRAKKEFIYKNLLRRNLMSLSSVVLKRDLMIPFPAVDMVHEDYVVWMQLLRKHGIAYGLDEPLLIYRIGEATKSSNRIISAKMTYNAYRYVGYGRFTACFLTLRYAYHSITKRMANMEDML